MNTAKVVEDKKISLEDIKKNPDQISQLSDEDLKNFFDQAKETGNYGLIATLATELARRSKAETVISDADVSEKLVKEVIEDQKKQAELQKKILESREEQSGKVDELKKQLESNEPKELLEQKFQEMEKKINEQNNRISTILEELLKHKKS